MRPLVVTALLLASTATYALGYEEFALYGLSSTGRLISFEPLAEDPIRAGEDIVGAKVRQFQLKNRVLLQNCNIMFDGPSRYLDCTDRRKTSRTVHYEGFGVSSEGFLPLLRDENGRRITNRLVSTIHKKVIEKYECPAATAYFVCRSNCLPTVPRTLLLIWCGD